MKALLINGSPRKEGCTYTALSEVAKSLEKHGVETEIFWIGNGPVRGCIDCKKCNELGRCVFDDDPANEIAAKIREADALVVGSPIYFAGPNGALCALLDRAFYSSDVEHCAHKPAAAVVSCRRAGSTTGLDRLMKYFTLRDMTVVGSQYWNMVHGFTPDDVRQDLEGLQTMRRLGENMAYEMKLREHAKDEIIPEPQEPRQRTNFIR